MDIKLFHSNWVTQRLHFSYFKGAVFTSWVNNTYLKLNCMFPNRKYVLIRQYPQIEITLSVEN